MVRTALAKANAPFDPNAPAAATPAAVGRPVGTKKAKAVRDAAPAIEKIHSSILACIADAATHAATRVEQAAKMEEVASARWASVMERQDIKLDLIKANIVAKKRKEDLAILLVDTSGMDDDVKAWCAEQRATILAESRAPSARQPSTATPATATTPPATDASPSTATPPSPTDRKSVV